MIVWKRGVKLATVLVPNSVLAVFAATDNQIAGRIPIGLENNAVMSLPLDLLVTGKSGHDNQVLF
jgi:hypothetical protein